MYGKFCDHRSWDYGRYLFPGISLEGFWAGWRVTMSYSFGTIVDDSLRVAVDVSVACAFRHGDSSDIGPQQTRARHHRPA